MGWDRQAPKVVEAPEPPVLGRWVLAAVMTLLVCVLLFLLHASGRMPLLQVLNIWVFSGLPLLVWTLAFAARAHVYGGALSRYQFLEEEAQGAQQSWQGWAQRYLAVSASCVLLPDQVSASVLAQGPSGLPPRPGQARRIAALPVQADRAQAGLQILLPALAPGLQTLPSGQELRVTVLSDANPEQYEALRDALRQSWTIAMSRPLPAMVTLAGELSYEWIDETLKTASAAIELILVVQVHGEGAYSDGLAALLLCPDSLARALTLPVTAGLSRPMPLDIDALDTDFPLFLQTQASACQATGLLADDASWQPLTSKMLAVAGAHGASLEVEQQWIQESQCGLPGPFGHWLVTALGVEMVRHQRRPLLVLAREDSGHWISTVTTGELA